VSWVVTLQALYLSVYPSLVLYDTYSGTAFITLSIGPQAWTPIGLQEANLLWTGIDEFMLAHRILIDTG